MSRRCFEVADLHLGLARFGAGIEEQVAMLNRIADAVDASSADILVIAGDVFHSRRPAAPEILALVTFLKRVTKGTAVIISSGNHDGPGEVEDITGKPAGWLAAVDMPNVWAIPDDRVLEVRDVGFRVLPYIHRRSRLAADIDRLIAEPGPVPGRYGPVFVGHQTVMGSRLSASNIMQIGWDLTVGAEAFVPYEQAMLGHIHHQQELLPGVAYAGSPERFDFGEEDQAKGGLIWDLGERSPTPIDLGARELRTIELTIPFSTDFLKTVTPGQIIRIIATGHHSSWATLSRDVHRATLDAGAAWVRIEHRQERGPRVRVELDSNDEPLGALRSWCSVTGEDYEALEPLATEIVAAK